MQKFLTFLIALCLVYQLSLKADEGMWLLPLLEKLNMEQMQELGLELSADEI